MTMASEAIEALGVLFQGATLAAVLWVGGRIVKLSEDNAECKTRHEGHKERIVNLESAVFKPRGN